MNDTAIVAASGVWRQLQCDPAFVALMRVARIGNALTLAYGPLMRSLDDQSPRARRERFAAFFYAGATLFEGLAAAEGLARFYRDRGEYKNGFGKLLSNATTKNFRKTVLKPLRDKFLFHVDEQAVNEALGRFADDEVIVVTLSNLQRGNIYCDLADHIVLAYLFGDGETSDQVSPKIAKFMPQLTALFNEFLDSLHGLLPVVLHDMGCEGRGVLRPDPPSDDDII